MNRKQIFGLCVGTFVLLEGYFATKNIDIGIAELIFWAGVIAVITGGIVYALRDKTQMTDSVNPVDRICRHLPYLASVEMQNKYMIHATKDNYLLPEDLLEDVSSFVVAVEQHLPWTVSLMGPERQAVIEFGGVLNKESDLLELDEIPWDELVSNNEHWANIREAAQECLVALGFDLGAWETEQLSE